LNDFPWTDKSSDKWYIIYSHGHEGPYSLEYLEQKLKEEAINNQIKIWCEGLSAEMTLEAVLAMATPALSTPEIEDDIPPELPPLPIDEAPTIKEEPPSLKEETSPVESKVSTVKEVQEVEEKNKTKRFPVASVLFLLILTLLGGAFYYLQNEEKEISLIRPQGMSLKVADKINNYLEFKGWREPLFFKEFVADDYKAIWLASSSFHSCEVTAHFKSQKDKLLSLNEEDIEFEVSGKLKDHLVNFGKVNFINGRRIVPGMYEMNIRASECEWDGFIAKAMNLFQAPEEEYSSKMSVILYINGADEFKKLLDKVTRKKIEKAMREQNQVELFWQGVQEKLQTLLAVSLQVEQLFLDFIKKDSRSFHVNLPLMVNEYTDRFGKFLTNFVVANEESFKEFHLSGIKGVSTRRNYELVISEAARGIGYTSMKLIEDLQKLKNPRRVHLTEYENKVRKDFSELKNTINQKIIQVSDDRSLSPDEGQEVDNLSDESTSSPNTEDHAQKP